MTVEEKEALRLRLAAIKPGLLGPPDAQDLVTDIEDLRDVLTDVVEALPET